MELWRTKLIENFPNLHTEWENPDETIYTVFMELNAKCQDAHDQGDQMVLSKIYDFAAWCSRQKEKELWNAAGVSFYEHIIDQPIALKEIPRWIPPDVFHKILPLLQWRMGDKAFSELNARYGRERLKNSQR
jgi:hypothetical protein